MNDPSSELLSLESFERLRDMEKGYTRQKEELMQRT